MGTHAINNPKVYVITLFFIVGLFVFPMGGFCFTKGDINNDEIINLVESINALQVSAGLRTTSSSPMVQVPADFSSIQDAVDAASPGDTINIAPGTYSEHIVVNKALTLVGSGKDTTFIESSDGGETPLSIPLYVKDGANIVEVSNLTLRNGREGLKVYNNSYVYIHDSNITNNVRSGIKLWNAELWANNITISGTNGSKSGIDSTMSGTLYLENSAVSGYYRGVRLERGSSGWIDNCTISGNTNDGVHANLSSYVALSRNNIN